MRFVQSIAYMLSGHFGGIMVHLLLAMIYLAAIPVLMMAMYEILMRKKQCTNK